MATQSISGLNVKIQLDTSNYLKGVQQVQRAQKKLNLGTTAHGRKIGGLTDKYSKNSRSLLELSRGVEDFAIVIGNAGLGAALRASSNNLSQFFSIFAGAKGGAIAGFAIAIATIIPFLLRLVTGTKDNTKALKEYKTELDAVIASEKKRAQFGRFLVEGTLGGQITRRKKFAGEVSDIRSALKVQIAERDRLRIIARQTQRATFLGLPLVELRKGTPFRSGPSFLRPLDGKPVFESTPAALAAQKSLGPLDTTISGLRFTVESLTRDMGKLGATIRGNLPFGLRKDDLANRFRAPVPGGTTFEDVKRIRAERQSVSDLKVSLKNLVGATLGGGNLGGTADKLLRALPSLLSGGIAGGLLGGANQIQALLGIRTRRQLATPGPGALLPRSSGAIFGGTAKADLAANRAGDVSFKPLGQKDADKNTEKIVLSNRNAGSEIVRAVKSAFRDLVVVTFGG